MKFKKFIKFLANKNDVSIELIDFKTKNLLEDCIYTKKMKKYNNRNIKEYSILRNNYLTIYLK